MTGARIAQLLASVEADMKVYELRIQGLDDDRTAAAVRWELFLFPEVRDVVLTAVRPETVAVLYEGAGARPGEWCRTLAEAGFLAEPADAPDSAPVGRAA